MTSSRPTVDAAAGVTWSGRPSGSTRTWSSRAAVRDAISATAASSPACAHPASRRNADATPGRSHSDRAAGSAPDRHAGQHRARRQLIRQHPGHIPRRDPRLRRGGHRGGFLGRGLLVAGVAGLGTADRGQQLGQVQLMRPGQPLEAAGVVIGAGGSGHPDHLLRVAAGFVVFDNSSARL